jgi:hypothetical protein
MSDIYHIFGSQLDAAVVQALIRHEKHRRSGERAQRRELEREARKQQRSARRRRLSPQSADRN